MNHYDDRFDAEKKWNDRVKRINYDNLFFMMSTERPAIAEQFDALPFSKKVCFTSFKSDYPSSVYAKPYGDWNQKQGKQFWQTTIGMATGRYALYDVYELLMHGKVCYRIK